jgi:hypothetical protein
MARPLIRSLSSALLAIILMTGPAKPAAAAAGAAPLGASPDPAASDLTRALQATVYLAAPVDGDSNSIYVGAGAILSSSGYILTNYSLLFDQNGQPHNQAKEVEVGLNNPQDPTASPSMAYWAEFVKADQNQQFAIFKISSPFQTDGSLPGDLGLVTMSLGDSNSVHAGDSIQVLGYGDGDAPVPVGAAQGTILGQSGSGAAAFFTTDVAVGDGQLGGPVIDTLGQMIGLAEEVTNPDPGVHGAVDPLDLALPLVQTANLQAAPGGTQGGIPPGSGSGSGISPGASGLATATPAPAGVGTGGGLTVTLGTPLPGVAGFPTPAGTLPAASPPAGTLPSEATPGTGATARIANLIFSDTVDMSGQPGTPTTTFSTGTKAVFATFDYAGFQNGQTFTYRFRRPGTGDAVSSLTWSNGAQGHTFVNLNDENGLAEGSYVLTLALDGVGLASGTFTVGVSNGGSQGGSQGGSGAPTVSSLVFAEDATQDNQPIRPHAPGDPFSAQTTHVYALFSYSNFPAGPNNTSTWYLDGTQIAHDSWGADGGSGTWSDEIDTDDGTPLDQGHYRYEVDLPGGQVGAQGEFDLGSQGAGPTPTATDTGVQAVGTVTDADTGRPIANALVVSLMPGTDPQTFLAKPSQSLVFSTGRTDTQGNFTLSPPWARGGSYYVVAGTAGYQPAASNTPFTIDQDTGTPYEVTIQLHQAQ